MGLEAAGSQQKPVGVVVSGGISRAIVTTNPTETCSENMNGIPLRLGGGQEVMKASAFDQGFFCPWGKKGLFAVLANLRPCFGVQ